MTTTLLRIASVISLVFTAGHTLGGLQKWSPMGENEVLKAMTAVRFDTMGAKNSPQKCANLNGFVQVMQCYATRRVRMGCWRKTLFRSRQRLRLVLHA